MTEEYFLKAVGTFLIAMVRFTGFFINMPAYGEGIVPMRIKAGLSGLCALIVLPHLLKTQLLPDLGIFEYGLMIVKELVMGITLGFVVLTTIDALRFGGEIIGMQIGFSFVQVVNPESNRGEAIVPEFFQVVAVLMFLFLGGHIIILQAFAQSFELVPLAGIIISGGIVNTVVHLTGTIFFLGLQISMPLIGIILLGDVALGIIARTVPRMNIFQVGFPIKILLGLWALGFLLPFLSDLIKILYQQVFENINALLILMH